MGLHKKLHWLGLTGGIASGKSAVANLIRQHGWPVVDADEEARLAVRPGSEGLARIVNEFGPQMLLRDGTLDRKKMGDLVFREPAKLKQLEAILHPIVQEAVRHKKREFERQKLAFAVYEVPLLFEKNLQAQFGGTILVYSDVKTQLARLMSRNQLSQDAATARMATQMTNEEKHKRATWTIRNDGSLEDLALNVESLLRLIESSWHDNES